VNAEKHRFTMMIIPHSGKSTFSISVSIKALKILCSLLAVILVGTVIFASNFYISYTKLKRDTEELEIVAKDYNVLQQQLQQFLQKTGQLEERMQELEQLDNELRELLKEDPALKQTINRQDSQSSLTRQVLASRSGLDRQRALRQLHLLEQKIPEQEQSLKELKDAVIERSERLCHTPSIYPVSGTISSRFGYRKSPFSSRQEFHDGLDIAAPYGSAVAAAADGVVTFAGYKTGYGRTVTISHGYGYETSYCHLSSTLVKTGQQVKKGQVIAKVGSSGRSTGPHLHYMVKVNGQLKDPADFLK